MNTNEDVIFPPIRGISTYMQSGLFRMLSMLRMHYYAYLVPLHHKKYHSAISASIRTFDTIDHYGSSCVARNSWLSLVGLLVYALLIISIFLYKCDKTFLCLHIFLWQEIIRLRKRRDTLASRPEPYPWPYLIMQLQAYGLQYCCCLLLVCLCARELVDFFSSAVCRKI